MIKHMEKDLFKREANFFESSVVLRNEFNKAVQHFGFKNFTQAMNHMMREMARQFHIDAKIEASTIDKELRIELYGRGTTTPALHAADLHSAAER